MTPIPVRRWVTRALLRLHARRDRRDHTRGLGERMLVHALDAMPLRDVGEVRVCGPHVALFVFEYEQAHRPVESRERIRRNEQRAGGWIAEHEERGGAHVDPGVRRELRLVDLDEE